MYVFCLCCSCHKLVPLLAFTLSSLSLVGLMLTLWQLEDLPKLGVSSSALYLGNTQSWLVICVAQLTCKQSVESAFQYLCMMWNARSRQETKAWGRRGICCLMPSGRSWRSACNLNEFSWGDQKCYNPENSQKKANKQRKNSHQQSCNLKERDRLKYRKWAKFCLSHTEINLMLSPPWQFSFVVTDSTTNSEDFMKRWDRSHHSSTWRVVLA